MLTKYTLFALIALFNCLVFGQSIVSVTAPLSNASYTAGNKMIIAWINPTVETITQIQLSKGRPEALQPVSVIANNVDAHANNYTWSIPSNTAPGNDYALVFGTSPNLAYTGQFTIKAAAA